jgi:hypothetical protein
MIINVTKDGPTVDDIRAAHFRDASMIATMPSITVTADPGCERERDAMEASLAEMMLEIGNSSGDNIVGLRHALINPHACEPKQDTLTGIAAGREVICLASGPSAHDLMPWIVERQAMGAIVVCADSIFRGAVGAGIAPDFVCVLERDERMAAMVPPDLCVQSTLVCPPVVHPSVAAGWNGRRVWVWQTSSLLYDGIGPGIPKIGTGRSAGTLAAQISVLMKPARIILVGHDLCEIGQASHAGAAESLSSTAHQADLANPGNTYHRRAVVACVDGQTRPSTMFWRGCLADLAAILRHSHAECWNASPHGALIPHTSHGIPPGRHMCGALPLGVITPSRYGAWMHAGVEEECSRQLIRLSNTPETGMDYTSLLPAVEQLLPVYQPVMPLIMHVCALDCMAAVLRAHLDAASGTGQEQTHRRMYSLLRRRLIETMRATIGAMRESP